MSQSKYTYVQTGDDELDLEFRKSRLGIDQFESELSETDGQNKSKSPNAEEIYTQLNTPQEDR